MFFAAPDSLASNVQDRYQQEFEIIEKFVDGLWQVQRLMAHLPCAMMFDDHDVTDDRNLTAGWEQAAYGQPFFKRIIGNTLLGYLIFQGWGNAPEQFPLELLAWEALTDLQQLLMGQDAVIMVSPAPVFLA